MSLLSDLESLHLEAEGQQMMQGDIAALTLLDPAAAVAATEQIMLNALGDEFARLVDDPSLIDPEIFQQATYDSWVIALQGLKNTANLPNFYAQTLITLTNVPADDVKKLGDFIRASVIRLRTDGLANLQSAMDAQLRVTPLADRSALSQIITNAQKMGIWGSFASAAAYASFGYKVNQGAFDADSTPMERWGAARDLISAVSYGTHPGLLASHAFDNWISPNDSRLAFKALGLDRTLPQIWGTQNLLTDNPVSRALSAGYDRFWSTYDNLAVADDAASRIPLISQNSASSNLTVETTRPVSTMTEKASVRVAQTIYKVFTGGLHLVGGVIDMVIGGIMARDAAQRGDIGMAIVGGVQVAAGAALTAAGGILAAQLAVPVAPLVAAAAWPLALVAAGVGAVAAITAAIVNRVKKNQLHSDLQATTDQQSEWFAKLDQMGLTQENFDDKLEFVRYAYATYGNDNTDPNKSYFEVQEAEWEHFLNTEQKNGSSLNRLNHQLHVHSDKTSDAYYGILVPTTPVSSWG
jgi:hypothetical protein